MTLAAAWPAAGVKLAAYQSAWRGGGGGGKLNRNG